MSCDRLSLYVTGPREQVNQVTSYIDGSMVYGSSVEEMSQLRQFEGGQLKMANSLLPTTEDESGCIRQRRDVRCFQSGEQRISHRLFSFCFRVWFVFYASFSIWLIMIDS